MKPRPKRGLYGLAVLLVSVIMLGQALYANDIGSIQKNSSEVTTPEIKRTKFRSEPIENFSEESVKSMILSYNFYCKKYNPQGSGFQNNFRGGDRVILDRECGLMWQQSGSEDTMEYESVHDYISQLNQKGFAGYRDWRLPTLEEAMSLMEPIKHDLYIDPLFDKKQVRIWTSDLFRIPPYPEFTAWTAVYIGGFCHYGEPTHNYVRAVRAY